MLWTSDRGDGQPHAEDEADPGGGQIGRGDRGTLQIMALPSGLGQCRPPFRLAARRLGAGANAEAVGSGLGASDFGHRAAAVKPFRPHDFASRGAVGSSHPSFAVLKGFTAPETPFTEAGGQVCR